MSVTRWDAAAFRPAPELYANIIYFGLIHSSGIFALPLFVWSTDTLYHFLRNARLVISSYSRFCVIHICLTLSIIPGLGFHGAEVCLGRGPGSPPLDGLTCNIVLYIWIIFFSLAAYGSISEVEVGSAIRKI